jgi:hypothetical protein
VFLVLERDSINLRMSIFIFSATCFLVFCFFCAVKDFAGDYEAFEMEFKVMFLHFFIFGVPGIIMTGGFEDALALCPCWVGNTI